MKTNNLQILKALLDEVLLCFVNRGQRFVVARCLNGKIEECVDAKATNKQRRAFADFRSELMSANEWDEIGNIALRARIASVTNNFYPPRAFTLLNARLVCICTLEEEGVLAKEKWSSWRSARTFV